MKYKIFTKPSQVKKAYSKAKEKDDKIAMRKLRPFLGTKFKKFSKVQVAY